MLRDERVVERAQAFQFRGQRPGEQHIGAGQRRQMQVGLLGDLGAQRIDHDQPAALALATGGSGAPDAGW